MKDSLTWVAVCATLALSGCAAGLVGSADVGSEVRLLAETVASAPRVVLAAELDGPTTEQPPAASEHDVILGQSNSAPPRHAPVAAIELTTDDPRPADDGQSMLLEPPAARERRVSDAPTPGIGSTFHDAPPPGNEPVHVEAVASDGAPASVPRIPHQDARPITIERGRIGPKGPPAGETKVAENPAVSIQDSTLAPHDAETIVTPSPVPRSPFRPDTGQSDHDRFTRRVVDVPLDIRPTEGAMPDDQAAAQFANEPTIDETFPSGYPPDVFCSHTPWTFCYRPLYFEDIKLERYGANIGYAQTGLSGVRFFGSILALPYKMTVRPPRSCQCSNGFSRCGDCPLPGYGRREVRLDASLIEAAAVAGVVYFLP